MPTLYEKNKDNIAKWREQNRDRYLEIARRNARTYYEKNAEEIRLKKRMKYYEKKQKSEKNEKSEILEMPPGELVQNEI